jgi:hypothetical protein
MKDEKNAFILHPSAFILAFQPPRSTAMLCVMASPKDTLKALANSSPGFALKPWVKKGTFIWSQL